jgi:deoxyhypusine synthase
VFQIQKLLFQIGRLHRHLEPFLNEKICQYQIAITTPETTTGGDSTTTEEEAEANFKLSTHNMPMKYMKHS